MRAPRPGRLWSVLVVTPLALATLVWLVGWPLATSGAAVDDPREGLLESMRVEQQRAQARCVVAHGRGHGRRQRCAGAAGRAGTDGTEDLAMPFQPAEYIFQERT
jgi:hypothetical protein